MANIVIKKQVSLEFIGDEYKDAYLVFKAIPVNEYEVLIPKFEATTDRVENIKVTLGVLQDKFISGQFPVEGKLTSVSKEDLGSFDEDTLAHCLGVITGQITDPK